MAREEGPPPASTDAYGVQWVTLMSAPPKSSPCQLLYPISPLPASPFFFQNHELPLVLLHTFRPHFCVFAYKLSPLLGVPDLLLWWLTPLLRSTSSFSQRFLLPHPSSLQVPINIPHPTWASVCGCALSLRVAPVSSIGPWPPTSAKSTLSNK